MGTIDTVCNKQIILIVMTGKITYFKAEDFNRRGAFNQFYSECQLDNTAFRKGDVLKHEEIQLVLDTCKKYNNFGTNTLIVKDETTLTIWIEQISQRPASSDSNPIPSPAASNSDSSPQPSLPTKTVTKRYRGQVYEETVVDWAAVAMQKQGINTGKINTGKQRRKYRGNYID